MTGSTVATWVPIWGTRSPWVPIGYPFLLQGPHFLYLGLASINFANICFLGPHSAAEGPHLVPISLKLGPHFDKLGFQWHVATVRKGG